MSTPVPHGQENEMASNATASCKSAQPPYASLSQMATTTTTEAPKRSQGLLGLFRRAPKDPVESAELAQRKALAQEGHKYLSKATDLINNRDHFHVFERGHLELLQDRWGDLYGAAPKGKKLTKGILSPDEFREKAKILYEDVQAAFDGVRIDRSGPSSSHQSEPPPPPSEQSVHRGHSLRDPGPVPLAHPPERSGSSRDHASRKNSSRHPEDPIPEMGELALNTNDHSSSKRHRDRDRDKARHRPPPLPLDDPLTSHPGQDRSRYDDEAEERDPYALLELGVDSSVELALVLSDPGRHTIVGKSSTV
ncbi:hypothetical protein H0H93_009104 [Arthromyces matolae]|nr:hypothetical protein H0H93_009104 [Arthromyces matolae]